MQNIFMNAHPYAKVCEDTRRVLVHKRNKQKNMFILSACQRVCVRVWVCVDSSNAELAQIQVQFITASSLPRRATRRLSNVFPRPDLVPEPGQPRGKNWVSYKQSEFGNLPRTVKIG